MEKTYEKEIKSYVKKARVRSAIARGLIYLLAAISFISVAIIVVDVFIKGIPNLSLDMFAWTYTTENLSVTPAIINTIILVLTSLLMAAPVGIISAIYINEYMNVNSLLRRPIRIASQTLAGIPSIIYGLFGNIFFVTFLGWKYSILAGASTLAIMILPTIMTSTEESLMQVANSQREASYGLGAKKLRTVFNVVLPPAIPGILSGIVLSVGRIVGETAALLYTAGSHTVVPTSLMQPGRTLAIHMYLLSTEGMHKGGAYASGLILLLLVFIINALSTRLASWLSERSKNG